jgi:hypothetical protein
MAPRFETARLHGESGPASLFTRVRHTLGGHALLTAQGHHATPRPQQRNAPVDQLTALDPENWELVSADVRTNTGRWVKST